MAEIKKILLAITILVIVLLATGKGQTLSTDLPAGKAGSQGLTLESREIASACKQLQNREQCYAKAFENLTKSTDRNYAFKILRELQKVDPEARGCHFIAHAISTAETQKDPSKWKELMNSSPPDCSYGAAHGALEVYASTFPEGKLPKEEIPNLCNNPDTNNCTHILGHLLLVLNENDIPESLKSCQSLPHDSLGKFECMTGVFMERITALNLEVHGLATKEALNWAERVPELETLCRAQTGIPSVACWKEIVHAALIKFKNDPQQIVDFCEQAPGEEETRQCIDHSLGIMAAGYNFQLDKMDPICGVRVKNTDFPNRCYANLVAATLSTLPQEIPSAVKFCAKINPKYQESCFAMIGNSLRRASPEHKTTLAQECLHAPESFRERCEFGGSNVIKFFNGN